MLAVFLRRLAAGVDLLLNRRPGAGSYRVSALGGALRPASRVGGPVAYTGSHGILFLVQRLGEPTHPHWSFPAHPFASFRSLVTAAFPALAAMPPVVYLGLLAREGRRGQLRRTGAVRWPVVAAGVTGLAYLPQFLWERPDVPHLWTHVHLAGDGAAAIGAGTFRPALPPGRVAAAGFVLLAALGAP